MDTGSSTFGPGAGEFKGVLAGNASFGPTGANHAALLTIFPKQIQRFHLPLESLSARPFSSRYATPFHASKAPRGERFAPILNVIDGGG